MKTITQQTNRFSSEIDSTLSHEIISLRSLLWHLVLHKRFSKQDHTLMQSITPTNCSLFIIIDNKLAFKSDCYEETILSLKSDINYAYDASYVQQIESDNGIRRVLTIPFDSNIMIGLISSNNLQTVSEIEDIFMHKIYRSQQKYVTLQHQKSDMINRLDNKEPMLVISRDDNQIITCNAPFQTFCNLSMHEILELNLQELQNKYPKASKRKVIIKNCEISGTNCSIVQFTLKNSEIIQNEILIDSLKLHTEELIECYQQLKLNNKTDNDSIESQIKSVQNSYQKILQLQNN